MHQVAFALGTPRIQRLLQRIEHEVGLHRTAHPPADNAPREDIDDEGDVNKALPGRDVGEVGHPQLVRPLGLEVRLTRSNGHAALASGTVVRTLLPGVRLAARVAASDAPLCNAPLPRLRAGVAANLVGAIDPQVRVVHALHLRHQARVTLCSRWQQRRLALAGSVAPVRRRGTCNALQMARPREHGARR